MSCLGLGGIGRLYIFATVTILEVRNYLLVVDSVLAWLFYIHGLTSLY